MSNILNYKDKLTYEAVEHFEHLIEEVQIDETSEDYTIETNNHEVQGALLEIIDKEELEHRIELGGKIHVTIS
jgi:hypothetical protein